MTQPRPLRHGALVALAAAVAFGVTAPLVKLAGRHVGPFATAALLYCGAALVSLTTAFRGERMDAPVRRSDMRRLLMIALLGAALAPAALAWGLQHTTALTASLLLNAEAVFTVLLASVVYKEPLGRRVGLALMLIAAGGVLLILQSGGGLRWSLGALAVVAAALGWAGDNTVGRVLADRDPAQVVFWKGAAGMVLSSTVALILREKLPSVWESGFLVVLGATGYGLSLRLYLLAQRRLGAARTGSIFAAGPFVGALVAPALGDPLPGLLGCLGGALCGFGVWLHVTERHGHHHIHEPIEHDHLHRHDDGHHEHVHQPVEGAHSHPHGHQGQAHDHEHAPDLHHRHEH
jgi:drug/metabolite transporter (DMT)-like permease